MPTAVIPAKAGMTNKTAFTRRGGPLWPPVSDMSIPVVALRRDKRGGIELVSDRHGGLSLRDHHVIDRRNTKTFSTPPLVLFLLLNEVDRFLGSHAI